jgi:hypothetical protein
MQEVERQMDNNRSQLRVALAFSLLQSLAAIVLFVLYSLANKSAEDWRRIAINAIETTEKSNNGMRECNDALSKCADRVQNCKEEK